MALMSVDILELRGAAGHVNTHARHLSLNTFTYYFYGINNHHCRPPGRLLNINNTCLPYHLCE